MSANNVDAVQQVPQSASGERGFISDGLDLLGVVVHLLLLEITQGSVVHHLQFQRHCLLLPHGHCCGCHSVVAVELLACLLSHLVLRPNRMLIVCVPRNQVSTHTIQKMDTK
jgi:hypothetical protein